MTILQVFASNKSARRNWNRKHRLKGKEEHTREVTKRKIGNSPSKKNLAIYFLLASSSSEEDNLDDAFLSSMVYDDTWTNASIESNDLTLPCHVAPPVECADE
jgi:hypothetical protein